MWAGNVPAECEKGILIDAEYEAKCAEPAGQL
jgi:hypothetical protein